MEVKPITFHITGKLKTGEPACPRYFDARDVKFFIEQFDKMIAPEMGANRTKTTIGFQVEEGSEKLTWLAPVFIVNVLFGDFQAMAQQNLQNVNESRILAAAEIKDRYKNDNLNIDIIGDDQAPVFSINKDTKIEIPKDVWVQTEEVFYGTIENLGGTKPNFHLRTNQGSITISASQTQIIELQKAVPLYNQEIEVSVFCEENIKNGELRNFTFDNFRLLSSSQYNPEKLSKDIQKGVSIWGHITDSVAWVRAQRS